MVKKNLLRAKIVERQITYEECAVALDISKTTFSSKMNSKTSFSIKQATDLSNFLELTVTEMTNIFLT